jgi:hypothetical protein
MAALVGRLKSRCRALRQCCIEFDRRQCDIYDFRTWNLPLKWWHVEPPVAATRRRRRGPLPVLLLLPLPPRFGAW